MCALGSLGIATLVSKFDPHVIGLERHIGVALAEVGECLVGCIKIISGRRDERVGVDHLTAFDEFGHYIHGGPTPTTTLGTE
jgi:hypothetical protein